MARVGTEPEVPQGRRGSGDDNHLAGSAAQRRREGVDPGCLSPRRPALSGPAWFPRVGAGKNVPSHGAALGGAEVSSATAPEPVPVCDLRRGGLAHFAVCGFFGPRAGRL